MVEFNKMFVMLPVMLAARKLDGENPQTLLYVRVAYGIIQFFVLLIVFYTYYKASSLQNDKTIVYVPSPAVPFGDPNAKKKYTEIEFGKQCVSTARSLIGSTLFGILMTVGFHYYKGMLMGLAIQTVMAPFSLIENPLVKALLLSSTKSIRKDDKIFSEKSLNEITSQDEIVDENGTTIIRRPGVTNNANTRNNNTSMQTLAGNNKDSGNEKEQSLEEIMLDTWDAGAKADLSQLMGVINAKNVNTTTSDDKWTSLMILAGLSGTPGTVSAIRQLLALGADPTLTDVEGWNCFHWAGFHGSISAAKELCASLDTAVDLLQVTDKEGNTPAETALKEGNVTVADFYKTLLGSVPTDSKKDK